ncbi:MAG: hypothetical protein JWL77_1319 [Chthonomonadaceae bacterium]|nr:hypothetical protein [Chthonomonadaceae bacterium]
MPGRMRSLLVVLGIIMGGSLPPGVRAQQVKPNVWPPIDVWGVSGHPIGAIRLAQPTTNGILRYSLIGEFAPAGGKLLSELAVTLWPGADPKCLHFNWIQVTVNSGNLPLPVDAAGLPLNSPFLDPPAGGYQGDAKPADAEPWFLDETPFTPGKSASMNVHNPEMTLAQGLRWYAKPYSATTPDAMQYDTVLVLVNDCTSQYEPLGGFHWKANFPRQGNPFFEIAPFLPTERFSYGALVTAFAQSPGGKQKTRVWTIRPLVKP